MRKTIKENSLAYLYPTLIQEWNNEKNGELTPEDVSFGSGKKVWWQCAEGHEWESFVYSRTNGTGCPTCAKKQARNPKTKVTNETCLATTHPLIANEWHETKNKILTPKDVTSGSGRKVWWKCSKGHEWETTIQKRARGNSCPYCSGKNATKETCLATTHPLLVNEWHNAKNGSLTPNDLMSGSRKKVWWTCSKGHEWEAEVSSRTKGQNCPYCSGKKVSKETNLFVNQPLVANEWHPTKNGTLTPRDVTSKSVKKVWWQCTKGHEWQTSIYHRVKGTSCPYCSGKRVAKDTCLAITHPSLVEEWHPTKNGLLTPKDVTFGVSKKVWWQCTKGHEWETTIASRTKGKYGCPYCFGRYATKDTCLATTHPLIANEWHPTKNDTLTPYDVTIGSNKKAWWKCEKGHEWETIICSRKETNCPYCSKQYVTKETCLATTHPSLVGEWHPTKNDNLQPTDVTHGSNKKVWWRCEKGHEWEAKICFRSRGAGCSHCTNERKNKTTCLATTHPLLINEWHETKNILTPTEVRGGSGKKVWWKCSKGHEWEATIASRTNIGSGCPYCSGRYATNETCLVTVHPSLAKEWHPIKNILTPYEVTSGSDKKVWWKCAEGHEWEAKINIRTKGKGCPYCIGSYATKETCLATIHPMLAKEWHPTKNGVLTPYNVLSGSGKKVWWKCEKGHEWEDMIHLRVTRGNSCPYCSGKRATKETCLATTHPSLSNEWHSTKNGFLQSTDVMSKSYKKVWWQCHKGHEWETTINSRTSGGSGCPYCSGRRATNETCLAITHPSLVAEWHDTKNSGLTPYDVTSNSYKKA